MKTFVLSLTTQIVVGLVGRYLPKLLDLLDGRWSRRRGKRMRRPKS